MTQEIGSEIGSSRFQEAALGVGLIEPSRTHAKALSRHSREVSLVFLPSEDVIGASSRYLRLRRGVEEPYWLGESLSVCCYGRLQAKRRLPRQREDVVSGFGRLEEIMEDQQVRSHSLWSALRSDKPVEELTSIVETWKAAGCNQAEAESRLTKFLYEVIATGAVDEDDPVRDVLDFVAGFCSPDARLFP